jgi:hypothetical protein
LHPRPFPNDDAALKLLYLAIENASLRWRRSIEWTAAMGQFASNSASAFRERRDDQRLHGNGDSGSARTFAVKSRACGTPLRGFGT